MRLKHLELQGYKTFASRTRFAFDGGITAIVGPNGSGKSNIADAIRWVLGEQSFRTLRGKRTEDMIFSGSSQRARLGMASASLVLDNSDGWLPIDFSEVTVTRRAYRSGENEYILNGSRVRLRDIGELLAKSGLAQRTYTVIGQGLVDAVLSLRAEDRRALFEEAAGIALYRDKRSEALSRLDETRTNLIRVNDIVNEIAPRLVRLEGQAERATLHANLEKQLEGLLRTWYGYRWLQAQISLQRAQDSLSRREARLVRRRAGLDDHEDRASALRVRQSQLRETLGDWHRESGELHRQMEEVQRDLAVQQERARQLARQSDELAAEVAGLETQAQAFVTRIEALQSEVTGHKTELRAKQDLVEDAQKALDALESQRAVLSKKMADAQARAFELAAREANRDSRLAQVAERRASLDEQKARSRASIKTQEDRAALLRTEVQSKADQSADLEGESERLAALAVEAGNKLARGEARDAALRDEAADARMQVDQLQARYDLLSQLRRSGEDMPGGVRAVLEASRPAGAAVGSVEEKTVGRQGAERPGLAGLLGTVAQLIGASSQYEIAVEAALGSHVQDIVVETWSDAKAAIAFLAAAKHGRATFLPLDILRLGPRLEVPPDQGVIGIAADMVLADPPADRVAELLLGRTLIVHDLEAARNTLDRLRGEFQVVTLAGEVVTSQGSVMGGREPGRKLGQTLAREREWRELPIRIREAQARHSSLEGERAQVQEALRQTRDGIASINSQRQACQASLLDSRVQLRQLERELAHLAEETDWHRDQLARLDIEQSELVDQESAFQDELSQILMEKANTKEEVDDLQRNLDQLRGESFYQRLSEARTAAAVARGAWEHRRAALEALQERQADQDTQIKAKQSRIASLHQEQAELADQTKSLSSREAVIRSWLGAVSGKIKPVESELEGLEAERDQMTREETELRARLREAENSHAQALLAQSRHQDRMQRLRRQIVDDFGLVEMESAAGLAEQLPLPLAEMVSSLPVVETLPEGLEEEIHQTRAQMRRLGYVNPNAPEEFAEALERHKFLTLQAADLEGAAQQLWQVVAELDEVMHQEFLAMFDAVAERFEKNFSTLFGGGAAHLELTAPDDISQTGVEIVARPPGKRPQTLALLSGGERALTAVALIFALLETNLPPFCILDEVDAMLDEANVRRFRQMLETLALQTQFIVITHNRATITAADTIYGVSMGEDSVSQVVSLKLEGDHVAPAGTSPVKMPA